MQRASLQEDISYRVPAGVVKCVDDLLRPYGLDWRPLTETDDYAMEMLTLSKACLYADVSRPTLDRWIKQGELEFFTLPNGAKRLNRLALRKFLLTKIKARRP